MLPALRKTKLTFLQGWGEPFLHPDFFEMASAAKKLGCRVGTTTNGMLLDEGKIIRLVECGLDVIAFSLAGTDERNDAAREGTHLDRVLENIRRLHTIKRELGVSNPSIHIAYLLLKSGLKDGIQKLPRLLQGIGIAQVVISTLAFIPDCDLEEEILFPSTLDECTALKKQLDAVVEEGKDSGLQINYYLGCPGHHQPVCTENVRRAFFVSSDGTVSPCVFTNIPVTDASYYVRGVEYPYRNMTFGNLNEQSIGEIWYQKSYVDFRNSFDSDRLADCCRECPKLYETMM